MRQDRPGVEAIASGRVIVRVLLSAHVVCEAHRPATATCAVRAVPSPMPPAHPTRPPRLFHRPQFLSSTVIRLVRKDSHD